MLLGWGERRPFHLITETQRRSTRRREAADRVRQTVNERRPHSRSVARSPFVARVTRPALQAARVERF